MRLPPLARSSRIFFTSSQIYRPRPSRLRLSLRATRSGSPSSSRSWFCSAMSVGEFGRLILIIERRGVARHCSTKRRELQRSLRRDDASPQEYFSRASRAVQLKTALAKNLDPNTVDAEIAASAFRADEDTRRRLRHLFEKSDEARYSGSGRTGLAQSHRKRETKFSI